MRQPSMSVVSSFAALALLCAAASVPQQARAGGVEEEAARQLELARGDLEAGKPDRAIKAAKSALRLDPTQVDALLLHALALEAMEDYSAARALALAYLGAAGAEASSEAEALVARVDRAEPVRTTVEQSDGGKVVVSFSAREHVEDPVLHWRVRGEWKEVWMERTDQGDWTYSMTLEGPAAARLSWWVETGLGEPLMAEGEDGEERPFRLAVK